MIYLLLTNGVDVNVRDDNQSIACTSDQAAFSRTFLVSQLECRAEILPGATMALLNPPAPRLARRVAVSKRTTLTWTDFSSSGFSLVDAKLGGVTVAVSCELDCSWRHY